jgi:hypothetical protein
VGWGGGGGRAPQVDAFELQLGIMRMRMCACDDRWMDEWMDERRDRHVLTYRKLTANRVLALLVQRYQTSTTVSNGTNTDEAEGAANEASYLLAYEALSYQCMRP